MEYCPYETAFEILPRKEERKEKKRKHKVNLDFLDNVDPDRPALGNRTDILSLQALSEAFTDISSNFVAPKVDALKPLPKYFLGGDDDYGEAFTDVIGTNTKDVITSQNTLPTLSTEDNWKPVTPSNSYTAFYDTNPRKQNTFKPIPQPKDEAQEEPISRIKSSGDDDIATKIDLLFKRLDALEKECKGTSNPNNQKEILYFVGTGFVFLIGLHIMHR